MRKWEVAESYLHTRPSAFTNKDMAAHLGITGAQASDLIQSYQDTQQRKGSLTQYVIYREGRTSVAVWYVGVRATDARSIVAQTVDDWSNRLIEAVAPTLTRMGVDNSRITALVAAQANLLDASLNALAASLP